MIGDEQIEQFIHTMRQKAKEYSKAKSDQTYLDQFRKTKLAIMMKEALVNGHETVAAQDREARASLEYQEVLQGLRAATEKAVALEWDLFLMRTKIDLYRTKSANERAERKTYGA